jgi:hypothetical protein
MEVQRGRTAALRLRHTCRCTHQDERSSFDLARVRRRLPHPLGADSETLSDRLQTEVILSSATCRNRLVRVCRSRREINVWNLAHLASSNCWRVLMGRSFRAYIPPLPRPIRQKLLQLYSEILPRCNKNIASLRRAVSFFSVASRWLRQ